MSGRNLEANQTQSQYAYEQNRANYIPIDNCANYQNSQRIFKKIPSNNSKKSMYKNPEKVLSNYQTYFVPVTNYDATKKVNQQSIHTHYSYSSNSLYPTFVQDQEKVNDGRNKVIYLKYPDDDNVQFKSTKYNNQSKYLLKEQENFYEYDFVPTTQNYSYVVSENSNQSNYKHPSPQLSKMMYSSYVPDIDVKFGNNPNIYCPYSSEPSISSQRSLDDIIDFPLKKTIYNEEPEKISANNVQGPNQLKKFPDILKRLSKPNISNKNTIINSYLVDSIYGTPCNETPTKHSCTINANTQTSNHNLLINTEYTQTENDVKDSRSKETQTLNAITGNQFVLGVLHKLANKGFFIYSSYLKMTIVRWLRRILIELAWSVYNCPSNCPMQDRIISSYLNHIERKVPTESSESQTYSSAPSRRSCKKQRIKK